MQRGQNVIKEQIKFWDKQDVHRILADLADLLISMCEGQWEFAGDGEEECFKDQFSSVDRSCLTLCDPMYCRLPCSSPTLRVYSNSCPLSRWCHPAISSSVITFSSRLQSFLASGSFQLSQLFASGGKSIGVSAST